MLFEQDRHVINYFTSFKKHIPISRDAKPLADDVNNIDYLTKLAKGGIYFAVKKKKFIQKKAI